MFSESRTCQLVIDMMEELPLVPKGVWIADSLPTGLRIGPHQPSDGFMKNAPQQRTGRLAWLGGPRKIGSPPDFLTDLRYG
jgi:hypothetical protein